MNKFLSSAMYCSAVMTISATVFLLFCGLGNLAFMFFSCLSILSAAAFAYRIHDVKAYPKRFLFIMLVAVAIICPITAYVVRNYSFDIMGQIMTGTEATYFCAICMVLLFVANGLCQYVAGRAVKWAVGTTWDKRLPCVA